MAPEAFAGLGDLQGDQHAGNLYQSCPPGNSDAIPQGCWQSRQSSHVKQRRQGRLVRQLQQKYHIHCLIKPPLLGISGPKKKDRKSDSPPPLIFSLGLMLMSSTQAFSDGGVVEIPGSVGDFLAPWREGNAVSVPSWHQAKGRMFFFSLLFYV